MVVVILSVIVVVVVDICLLHVLLSCWSCFFPFCLPVLLACLFFAFLLLVYLVGCLVVWLFVSLSLIVCSTYPCLLFCLTFVGFLVVLGWCP